jgi:hypothetical protein
MHSVYVPEQDYLDKQKGINACVRKDIYIKIEHAIQQAKLASEREEERVIFYRCKVCAHFHLSKLRNLKIDWKKVRKIIGTNNITYVMYCPNGDIHINDIYHYGFIIAYKMNIGVFKHCSVESPKFHNINIYSSLIELHANERETELYQKLLEEQIMVKENVVHESVKVEKKGPPIPELSWLGFPVIKGKKGYTARIPIQCMKCNGPEFAIKKVSVVNGVVTRGQGTYPENPEMIKPKPGVKGWIHKSCLTPSTEKSKEVKKRRVSTDKINIDENKEIFGFSDRMKDMPFRAETIVDLVLKLDPENIKVSDAHARGMAWLFLKEISERLTK